MSKYSRSGQGHPSFKFSSRNDHWRSRSPLQHTETPRLETPLLRFFGHAGQSLFSRPTGRCLAPLPWTTSEPSGDCYRADWASRRTGLYQCTYVILLWTCGKIFISLSSLLLSRLLLASPTDQLDHPDGPDCIAEQLNFIAFSVHWDKEKDAKMLKRSWWDTLSSRLEVCASAV